MQQYISLPNQGILQVNAFFPGWDMGLYVQPFLDSLLIVGKRIFVTMYQKRLLGFGLRKSVY
jgi:hypothetical protein